MGGGGTQNVFLAPTILISFPPQTITNLVLLRFKEAMAVNVYKCFFLKSG